MINRYLTHVRCILEIKSVRLMNWVVIRYLFKDFFFIDFYRERKRERERKIDEGETSIRCLLYDPTEDWAYNLLVHWSNVQPMNHTGLVSDIFFELMIYERHRKKAIFCSILHILLVSK